MLYKVDQQVFMIQSPGIYVAGHLGPAKCRACRGSLQMAFLRALDVLELGQGSRTEMSCAVRADDDAVPLVI